MALVKFLKFFDDLKHNTQCLRLLKLKKFTKYQN